MSDPTPAAVAPSTPVRILAILNPDAGRGDVERVREAISGGLEGTGTEITFADIGGGRTALELAAGAARDGYHLVLVAGGDGTVARAAAGLAYTGVPMGIIPVGTGNIVANNLGIPMSPREAARAACLGTPLPYDLGCTDDGHVFALAAGAGYDADLIRDADRELKRRWGPLAYLFAMFKNLYVKRARYLVELDRREKIHVHAKMVLVTNVSRTMGALPLAPDALVDDGRLDVVIFTFAGFGQLLLLFLKALLGLIKQDPRVRFYQAAHVRISASRPIPLQVDGESISRTTPIEFRVLPQALLVMRPPARTPIDLAGLAESALRVLRELQSRWAEEARQNAAARLKPKAPPRTGE